jgi:hypothetical protein
MGPLRRFTWTTMIQVRSVYSRSGRPNFEAQVDHRDDFAAQVDHTFHVGGCLR